MAGDAFCSIREVSSHQLAPNTNASTTGRSVCWYFGDHQFLFRRGTWNCDWKIVSWIGVIGNLIWNLRSQGCLNNPHCAIILVCPRNPFGRFGQLLLLHLPILLRCPEIWGSSKSRKEFLRNVDRFLLEFLSHYFVPLVISLKDGKSMWEASCTYISQKLSVAGKDLIGLGCILEKSAASKEWRSLKAS